MKKLFLILLFLLMPSLVFSQVTMRDYPLNSSPSNNDTLLGIDEHQDAANWAVNNFTFPGIVTYLNNQADYLRSASTFTTANEVVVATGSGRQTQRTPVLIDPTGTISNVSGLELVPGPNPEWCFQDSDDPDADKCVAYVGGNYVATGNGDLIFSAKIGNVKTEIGKFDSANTRWDFGNYALVVLTQAYSAAWNGNNEVPTKDAVYDKIETLAGVGEVNTISTTVAGDADLVANPSKIGVDLRLKSLVGGANVNITETLSQVTINATDAVGENNTISTTTPGDADLVATPSKVGADLRLKSLVEGSGIQITETVDQVVITNTQTQTGEANDLVSVGTGEEIRVSKVGANINVKDIAAGAGISVATSTGNIVITNTQTPGEANTISTTTPGNADLVATPDKVGVDLRLKSLVQGTGISISETADQVTINNTQTPGEVNDGENVGAGVGQVYAGKSGLNIQFKSIAAGPGINVDNGATEVTPSVIFANTAEIEAGTEAESSIAPDQLAASNYANENIGFNVVDNDQAAAAGVLAAAYSVPTYLENHRFASMTCSVWDAGVGGSMTVQAIRRSGGANVNMLTAALTITTEFFITSTAVNAANAPLNEGDILTVEILTVHTTTPANGVHCTMELVPDI